MLPAIGNAQESNAPSPEDGFTLIELLVAILISSILLSIAVPSYMNQRREAVDSETKTAITALARKAEVIASVHGYGAVNMETIKQVDSTLLSTGTVLGVSSSKAGFCLTAYHPDGENNASKPLIYDSALPARWVYNQEDLGGGACAASVWGNPITPAYKADEDGKLVPLVPLTELSSVCHGVRSYNFGPDFVATTTAGENIDMTGSLELSANCRQLKYKFRVNNAEAGKTYAINLATSNLVQNGTTYSTGVAKQIVMTGTAVTEGTIPTQWTETSNWQELRIDNDLHLGGMLQYDTLSWKLQSAYQTAS